MSATGLDVFDKTLQTTHIWLDQIMEKLGQVPEGRVRKVRGSLPKDVRNMWPSQKPTEPESHRSEESERAARRAM